MDFNVAFENGDGLLNTWQQCFQNLFNFLSNDNHVKEKNVKALIEHLKSNNSISESKCIYHIFQFEFYIYQHIQ